MFFISSIALYSVVSKNLLAVYPDWTGALTWAFPVVPDHHGRHRHLCRPHLRQDRPAQRRHRRGRLLRRRLVPLRHRHRALAVLPVLLRHRRHRQRSGLQPGAHDCGQKWFIDKKGLASGITLAASTAGPAVLSPVLASLLIPSLGIFGALKALGVIFFVTILAFRAAPQGPQRPAGCPQGYVAPAAGAHAGTFGDLTPAQMVRHPALLGPHRDLRLCRHRRHPARGQGGLHRRRPALR